MRNLRKERIGVVTSNKMDKSIVLKYLVVQNEDMLQLAIP